MSVPEWIDDFLERHRARLDPFDWPNEHEWFAYVGPWLAAFADDGVSEPEAEAASVRLALAPPRYRREHLPAVMAIVRETRRPKVNLNEWLDARPERLAERDREFRRRAELEAVWAELTAEDQEYVRSLVVRENPGLARFEPFVRRLCLERVRECVQ